jgi:hypothetical protein
VPAERLLVYEVKQSWGPLCEFLGVEGPRDEPFPHLNEGEQFPKLMRRAMLSELAPRQVGKGLGEVPRWFERHLRGFEGP